jgi:hypothetical protein
MMRTTITTAAAIALAALCCARAAASPEDAVLAAESALNSAVARHDAAAAGRHLTADYTLTTAAGLLDRAAVLADIADPSFTYTRNAAHDQRVRFYGPDTAVVTGILEQVGTLAGRPVDAPVRYTDTWVRIDGAWLEAAGHASAYKKAAS